MLKRLWIGFALAFILGMTVEFNRGNPPKTKEPVVVQDEAGRRLLLLIIDSLSIPNFKAMPALREHAEDGFYAEVEPCLERITYVCVKETLTGRTAFTLFGLFQNFGVGATDPGANLLRDARAAGMSVAMVSAGDLKPFKVDVDIDFRSGSYILFQGIDINCLFEAFGFIHNVLFQSAKSLLKFAPAFADCFCKLRKVLWADHHNGDSHDYHQLKKSDIKHSNAP